jgi:hypothetical protein
MVRLMLTLAPVACILGAVGMSGVLNAAVGQLKKSWRSLFGPATAGSNPSSAVVPVSLSAVVAGGIYVLTVFYALHATFVSSEAYSSPSIVLGAWCFPSLSFPLLSPLPSPPPSSDHAPTFALLAGAPCASQASPLSLFTSQPPVLNHLPAGRRPSATVCSPCVSLL